MRNLVFVAMLAASAPVAAQNASPFCLVNQFGNANCFYYSLDACRQAQSAMGGICSANPAAMQQRVQPMAPAPAQQSPNNIAESFSEGYERGARMRRERELHQAQLRTLEAQAEAAERQIAPAPPIIQAAPANNVLYRCPMQDGTTLYTAIPAVNCVVVSVR